MAEVERFDDKVDRLEKITKNPKAYREAVTAAKYFGRALNALQVEFQPDINDDDAMDMYFSLIRRYLLEAADDIKETDYDDDAVG